MQTEPAAKRFRRGDVRAEDGKIFWGYNSSRRDGDRWVTPQQLAAYREKDKARLSAYHTANRDKITARKAAYHAANRAEIAAYQAAYRALPDVKARRNARRNARRKTDPLFAFQSRLRARTHKAFNRIGKSKPALTEELLGCAWEKAKAYIEKQFAPGMSWENRSEWHIDHVIPLASAYDEYTTMMLCHFTNLKPLWKRENSSKNDAWYPPEYHI